MTSVNILPGSLNVTGNISATQASVGGNLVVGSNIYVSGNLYSANVTVSGGGGGGGGGSGVSSIVAGNGITTSTSTGNVTVNALVAGICGGAGIDVVSNSGVWTLCADVASINAGQGIFVDNTNRAVTIRNTGVFGPINITNDSGTGNLIGGVSLSDGKIGATNVVNSINVNPSEITGLYTSGGNTTGNINLRAKVRGIVAGSNVTVTELYGVYTINASAGSGGGGISDASSWSTYRATSAVNLNNNDITNTKNIEAYGDEYFLSSDPGVASYISTLNISTNIGYSDVTLHPFNDGYIRLTGNGGGLNAVAIDSNGSISNNANTSSRIGGIQLSNSNLYLVQSLNLKDDGSGLITNVRQITNNSNAGRFLDISVGGVSRINDLVIDSTGGSGPILRTAGTGSNFYISADPSSASGTTNSVYVTNVGSLVGNRYLLSNVEGGGRINIFGNSIFNDSGPKAMLETISGGTEVAVGQYRNSVNASDALNIYCGPVPRIVVKNDIVNFRTSITNGALTIGNDGFNGYIQPVGLASYVYVKGDSGNCYIFKDTGRISNFSTTSNNIGGVVLSNTGIHNFNAGVLSFLPLQKYLRLADVFDDVGGFSYFRYSVTYTGSGNIVESPPDFRGAIDRLNMSPKTVVNFYNLAFSNVGRYINNTETSITFNVCATTVNNDFRYEAYFI